MTMSDIMPVTRRATIGGLGAALALGRSTVSFGADASSPARLIVLNVRGGLDGLATVIPYGDPALPGLRAGLVPPGIIKLDPLFALHPSLAAFHAMMQAREAMVVHAVGPVVRIRSHFAGQDYLQSGATQLMNAGWLNRVLGVLGNVAGLSMAIQTPLLMQGATTATCYAPEPYVQAPDRLTSQLAALTAGDSQWGPSQVAGLADRALFNSVLGKIGTKSGQGSLAQLAGIAGRLMASPTGPRIAALDVVGADTHDDQNSRVAPLLASIDAALAALKTSLGAAWATTVVMTMTEFGRTAYENGTGGTDHGTAFAMLLAGGAVNGGQVLTRWPGLGATQLFQGRDLAPTIDFRSVAMGILVSHLGIAPSTQPVVFPGSSGIVPLLGLTS